MNSGWTKRFFLAWLAGEHTDELSLLMKVGRQKFIYIIDNIELIEKAEYVGDGTQNYFGVNLSGAEFGGIYPGVDGTHYGYPTYKDLDYFKGKGLNLIPFSISLGTYPTCNERTFGCNGVV